MDIRNENHHETEVQRLLVLFSLIGFCCFITFYSGLVLNTNSVYTHFFYIPIFLASLWWRRKGIAVVFFLGFVLLAAYNFFFSHDISCGDYLRVFVFVSVGLFLSLSMENLYPAKKTSFSGVMDGMKAVAVKDSSRIVFIAILVVFSCALTVYFHVVENKGTVFSHFFYIPIILSAMWWKRRGLAVAFFLASFLVFGHFFLRNYVITINDYFRAAMFIIVPIFVSFLGDKISRAENRIRFLDLVVRLVQNVNRLVIHEIDRKRLAEGIASAITESPGCLSVSIVLFNEMGEPAETVTMPHQQAVSDVSLSSCQERALESSKPALSVCNQCQGCENTNLESFSYMLEYDGLIYGVISVLLSKKAVNDEEQLYLLKSVSDEFAYALYNIDIEKKRKNAEEAHRLDELRIKTIFDFSKITGSSSEEMTLFALREAVKISRSETGYIAFINDENYGVDLMSLSDANGLSDDSVTVKKFCKLYEAGKIFDVVNTGRPLITEYTEQLEKIANLYGKCKPKLRRHMDIPVFASGKVVFVVGLGNRDVPYGESDIKNITLLMQGMWIILQHRRTEEELALYRENLREMVKIRTEELEEANKRLKSEIKERNILYKNLEESSRELESFVHTVTHDLKSPLFSMGLCAGMLQKNYSQNMDDKGQELLLQIKKSTVRMEELIKDVLTLSRVGIEHDDMEEINILKLLVDISGRLGYLFEDNSVEFVVKNTLEEPVPNIQANRSQVMQVFENLLTNAVKFMGDQEEPCVVVGFDSVDKCFCNFYVEDNGIGISEKDREKIFTEFYRTHDIDVDGTGIGLAIVKKIIEKHGGELSLDSEPGRGSTFYFSFPVKGLVQG